VVLEQPLPDVRRQQKRLLTITRQPSARGVEGAELRSDNVAGPRARVDVKPVPALESLSPGGQSTLSVRQVE
jgi:hypothetical protein